MHTDEDRRRMRRLLYEWGESVERTAYLQGRIDKLTETIDAALDVHLRRPDAGEPSGAAVGDGVARKAERHMQLSQMYEDQVRMLTDELSGLIRLAAAIDRAVSELERNQESVLRLKYKEHYTYAEICRKLHYSEIWVNKTERKAVDRLLETVTFE